MVYPDEEEFKWVLIIQPNREVFQKYAQHPKNINRRIGVRWKKKKLKSKGTLQFYKEILGDGSRYELHKTFHRSPQFLGIQISDKGAPFPMRALVHPEIRLYHRIE